MGCDEGTVALDADEVGPGARSKRRLESWNCTLHDFVRGLARSVLAIAVWRVSPAAYSLGTEEGVPPPRLQGIDPGFHGQHRHFRISIAFAQRGILYPFPLTSVHHVFSRVKRFPGRLSE